MIRILFADDSPDDVEQCTKVLRQAKQPLKTHRIENAADLRSALSSDEWDVVLAEHAARHINARDILAILKSKPPAIPLIVVAKQITDADVLEIMTEGARDVVIKGQWARLLPAVRRELQTAQDQRASARMAEVQRQLEDRYRVMVEGSREAVCYCHDGMHVDANPAYLTLIGCQNISELKGVPILNLIDKSDQNRFKLQLRSSDAFHDPREYKAVTHGGQCLPVEISMSSVRIEGEPCVQIVVTDISRRKALESKLEFLHQRDALTGLCNRPFFLQELGKAMEQVRAGTGSCFLIGLELRHMAELNHALGHAACDRLLLRLTRQLGEHLTGQQLFGRVGGGQFSVLMRVAERNAADNLLNELRSTADAFQFADGTTRSQCHIDVKLVQVDNSINDRQKQLELAFPAGAPTDLPQPSAPPTIEKHPAPSPHSAPTAALQEALSQERYRMMFQPLVNLHGEPRELYEACPFVETHEGTLLAPAEFMPLAEKLGEACKIDRWIAQQSIETLVKSTREGMNAELLIPISACGVNDQMLLPAIRQHLATTRLNAARLLFQIAAPIIKNHALAAREFLLQAKSMGARIALDDFDPVLLKIADLTHLDFDIIKVDCRILQSKNEDALRYAAHDAKTAGRTSVAKGVEDMGAFTLLWHCNFDYMQGDAINPPGEDLNYNFGSEQTLTSETPLANPWQANG